MKKLNVITLGVGGGIALAVVLVGLTIAEPEPVAPVGARGVVVVPEAFLRRWDPITIFFEQPIGRSGPEDRAKRFVTLVPSHPGAFEWLDAKTLQFAPAEPWPALETVEVRMKKHGKVRLATLMNPPVQTIPSDGADNLQPLDSITLTFPEPIRPESLAKMTRIEVRPRPGLDPSRARWLGSDDFVIKSMERKSPSDRATYVLQLNEAIPESKKVLVHFRLAPGEQGRGTSHRLSFTTLESFHLVSFGCPGSMLPATRDGATYAAEQAVRCAGSSREVRLAFSSPPAQIDAVVAKNLVRFTPAVPGAKVSLSGRSLVVKGAFEAERRYRLSVHPTRLADRGGRPLEMRGASGLSFYFPKKDPFLDLAEERGVVERYGPQTIPLSGRGYDKVDLRIFPIDPLDRKWWPFPGRPVPVDESKRPPGPGEEPEEEIGPEYTPSQRSIQTYVATLGSPPISELVTLPIARLGGSARFGLDLSKQLDHLSGKDAPGHYLVGVRKLDGTHYRHWMRLQVTDLAVSVLEEPHLVRFFVTSLRTGQPIRGAKVSLEGPFAHRGPAQWTTHFSGKSNGSGQVTWKPPGAEYQVHRAIRRLTVTFGKDRLVVDPRRAPRSFADGGWRSGRSGAWLDWTVTGSIERRGDRPEDLCHIFTERPVYRPDDTVHIKGYVRRRHEGALGYDVGDEVRLEVRGSGDLSFEEDLTLTKTKSFYHAFSRSRTFRPVCTRRCSTAVTTSGCVMSASGWRRTGSRASRFACTATTSRSSIARST